MLAKDNDLHEEIVFAVSRGKLTLAPSSVKLSQGVLALRSTGTIVGAKLLIHNAFSEKRFTSQLSDEEKSRWAVTLKSLELLLSESGAIDHPTIIYAGSNTLFCEIGKSDRTFTIAIDDEGSTISYRDTKSNDERYKVTSWDSIPPLHEFLDLLNDFLHSDQPRAWNPRRPPLSVTMMSSEDVFATQKTTTQLRTGPFVFCKELFTKTDLAPTFL